MEFRIIDELPKVETIHGQIIAKANNYQAVPDGHGGRRIIKTSRLRAYENSFIQQCKIYAGKMISTPFEIIVEVYSKSPKYDLDNSLKTLLDCLQYVGAIKDDSLCTRIVADKLLDPYRPRVQYCIIPETPQPTLF